MINSISIGSITIYFYSLCILLGVLVAYFIITKEAIKNNITENDILNILFYGMLIGIIGARIYYVVFNLDYYSNNISDIYKVWKGGLAIHGGIILGSIFAYWYSKKKNIDFIKLMDIILPGVIIAQGIGRWGNFFNQEAYGMMVSKELLEKLLIPKFVIKGMNIGGNYHLPTFYIESIFCIIGFIIMIILRKKEVKKGLITAFYMIWYGTLRCIIEYFRTDSLMFFNMKIAMLVSIILIIFGVVLFIKSMRSKE